MKGGLPGPLYRLAWGLGFTVRGACVPALGLALPAPDAPATTGADPRAAPEAVPGATPGAGDGAEFGLIAKEDGQPLMQLLLLLPLLLLLLLLLLLSGGRSATAAGPGTR